MRANATKIKKKFLHFVLKIWILSPRIQFRSASIKLFLIFYFLTNVNAPVFKKLCVFTPNRELKKSSNGYGPNLKHVIILHNKNILTQNRYKNSLFIDRKNLLKFQLQINNILVLNKQNKSFFKENQNK
ncbi:hypothetical protein BpHYR1_049939 [Brachionus plicatilis]|uniref:Uncharacterized protein n=1 Tax=Brachionus plicatilis TaxID=10195 RepID=A0A3M7RWE2_BRAPC|nr:hypothetical protein BpHYR1_049939 [Brachionus plicatilis]